MTGSQAAIPELVCNKNQSNFQRAAEVGLGNHIDFPPLMCLPCSESLASKQDDANAQFYFSDEAEGFLSTVLGSLNPFASSPLPFRHWCLLGEASRGTNHSCCIPIGPISSGHTEQFSSSKKHCMIWLKHVKNCQENLQW